MILTTWFSQAVDGCKILFLDTFLENFSSFFLAFRADFESVDNVAKKHMRKNRVFDFYYCL
jgi:hypothetical protein